MGPIRCHRHARLAGDRRYIERGGTTEHELQPERECFRRLVGHGQHLVAGASKLHMDAGLVDTRDAEAWRERHVAPVVDL